MKHQSLCIAFSAVLVLAALQVPARTIHVAKSGGDYTDIQAAADITRPGDTVIIHAGTYSPFVIKHSGAPNNYVVFRNNPGDKPVISGRAGSAQHCVVLCAATGYTNAIGWIVVEGLEIANAKNDGIKGYNIHNVIIRKCDIHHSAQQNILIVGGHHVTIEGNLIHNVAPGNTSNQNHGIYATGRHYKVVNNIFHSNSAFGLQIAGYDEIKDHPYILPGFDLANHWIVANNTFAFQKNRGGMCVWPGYNGSCADIEIFNNVFYKNSESQHSCSGCPNGIEHYPGSTNISIHDNLFLGAKDDIQLIMDAKYTGSANVTADPQFVNAAAMDFRLQPGSPAVDAGVARNAPRVDIKGMNRPQGLRHDLGAFEFVPAPGGIPGRGNR